jgi:MFS family permease
MTQSTIVSPTQNQTATTQDTARYAWVVLFVVFIASVAAPLNQFKVPPMMPVLMESFRVDLTMAGLLMSIFAVTGFVLALPAGFIFQKLGAKATGLIAVGCLVVGAVIGALSTTAGLLLASRVIEGVGMGLIAVVAPAVIAMWFPAERRGTPMGIWATWVPVGSVIMYVLAPTLGLTYGWPAVWWFGAVFALIAFILYGVLVRMPSEPASESAAADSPNLGRAIANRNIWLLGLAFGCFNLVVLALSTFLPTFLAAQRGYSLATASFVTSLIMIVTIGSAPLGGWLSDRIGSRKLLIVGPFIVVAVMLLFPFNVSGWLIPAYMILTGLVSGAIPTATFAAVPEVMSKAQLVGIGMAVVALGQNLGMFVGPVLFGKMVELTSWVVAGYLLIPAAIIGIIAAWLVEVR